LKAVVFQSQPDNGDSLQLATRHPEPQPVPGEVRVRTILAGICNTDLEVVRGYAGFYGVLGHEFVGVVDQAQDLDWLGKRVVGEINAACGVCSTCRAGRPTHCPNRTALGIHSRDGVIAECFCLPIENLHVVPDAVADEVAVFTEPLAAACEILEQVHIHPSDRVIVLGDGKLGLLVAQTLALTGCDLTVIGHHPEKLEKLAARGIAIQVGDAGLEGVADVVVDCTGQPQGFLAARQMVRPRGTLVLKSTYHGEMRVDLSSLVVDEASLVGSRCGPFPPALRLLAQQLVDVTSLIEAEYPLADALTAFEHAARRGALKVLIRP
jgi:threonine dehydrogenase-like Zn-dependent dehydrogenase